MLGFISDLHLEPSENNRTEAFFNFLSSDCSNYEALYILGDLFEYWVGDDDNSSLANQVKESLKNCSNQGLKIYFIHGNRDFLLGSRFERESNIKILDDQCILQLSDKKIMLSHGDVFCTDDHDYQKLKTEIRSEAWISNFLKQPLSERIAIAEDMRSKSKLANSNKPENIMDTNANAIDECFNRDNLNLLIHGHTHRPEIKKLPNDSIKVVLGSWEDKGWVFEQGDNHFDLRSFSI